MIKDKALKLALEALEARCGTNADERGPDGAITALREALAQPEQDPLEYWNSVEGWVKIDEVREHFDSVGCGTIYKTAGEGREPLYTTPPKRLWVGLTDEQWQIFADTLKCFITGQQKEIIEAKIKEKTHD